MISQSRSVLTYMVMVILYAGDVVSMEHQFYSLAVISTPKSMIRCDAPPLSSLSFSSRGCTSVSFDIDRFHYGCQIDSNVDVSKLRKSSQTRIWDPGLSIFEIGEGEVETRSDHMHTLCLEIRMTTSVYRFLIAIRGGCRSTQEDCVDRHKLGPVANNTILFCSALVLADDVIDDAIHSNGGSEKRRGSIPYGGFDDDRKGIPHFPLGFIMGHIDTSKTERLDCITGTNIQDATIPFAESICKRTKDFTAEANFRVTEPQLLRESLWQQLWERRQWIFQYQHRESLLQSSDILISTRRQDTEAYPITLNLNLLTNVMLRAFWSFSGKLIANDECVKGGLDRFICCL